MKRSLARPAFGIGVLTSLLCALGVTPPAFAAEHLPNLGCVGQARYRSMTWSAATAVTFINRTTAPVRTYWIDYSGKRVFYAEIKPCSGYVQQTYVTHPWVITGQMGDGCLAVFLPAHRPAVAIIDPWRRAGGGNACAPAAS